MLTVNTQPTYPPTGAGPYLIDRTWCLGDSLPYLNGNTNIFTNSINGLETTVATVSSNLNTNISTLTNTTSSTVITTLSTVPYARLNDGNQTGNAPIFGARAWVNFDGTRNVSDTGASTNGAPVRIRASGNITSVIKNSIGNYTVNFATAIPEGYGVHVNAMQNLTTGLFRNAPVTVNSSLQCGITTTTSGGTPTDGLIVSLVIFR